ncbi:MAG: helicase-associated domain-containing protein, partial [Solirubrobacterales bacterium]|nr:helicase-associated domain-containing protein [Solirubrobacterales bacterium]
GAGFVEVQAARSRAFTDRVVACSGVYDFAIRLRSLRRFHLLAADRPGEFEKYVDYTCYGSALDGVINGVLRKAGIENYTYIDEALKRYVMHRRWPDWVAQSLKDPVAGRILDVLRAAEGPVPLAELAGRLDGGDPDSARAAVDKLITHLALVEDLRPDTWELMVGFLPAVREEILRANQPRQRPPLVIVEHPREVGPDGSVIVSDLRALLLEVVSEPPRLRQDHALFQKESERFLAPLEPLAPWLLPFLKWTDEGRLNQALAWARARGLVHGVIEEKQHRLFLTPKGQRWLSGGLDEQYAAVYGLLISPGARHDMFEPHLRHFYPGLDPFSDRGPGDMRFLSEPVLVMKVEKGKHPPYYWDAKPADHEALRKALDQSLSELKPGTFYRLDSVVSHLAFAEHNPLNRGLALDQIVVFWGSRPVPPLEEQREEAARLLLDSFLRRRLIPLGCVRAAIDGEGQLAVARQPRCDAYFGRKVSLSDLNPAATATTRVVVQPDFSVIVIGLNPAPVAELAPFCERTTQGGGQGAVVLQITRASVVKAASQGLKPAEIVARLQRYASNEVPANVLREVREWSQWVRQVTSATLTVLRCPDRDTADRVMGALKRQAERINNTLVAIDQKRLTAAERTKLRSHGIIVEGLSEAREGKPKTRRRR